MLLREISSSQSSRSLRQHYLDPHNKAEIPDCTSASSNGTMKSVSMSFILPSCSPGMTDLKLSSRQNHVSASPRFFRRVVPVRPMVSMCDSPAKPSRLEDSNSEPLNSYVTVESANEMLTEAISTQGGDVHAFSQECARGIVESISQCYPSDECTSVFTVVGSGLNGLLALHATVLLQKAGYEPAVYCCYPSKYIEVKGFCEKHDLLFYDFVPSTLDFHFEVILDGLLGTGFDGGDIRQQYWTVYEALFSSNLPLVSIDTPSGWDLTLGPRAIDKTADTFVKPDVLVSLGAPKLCAKTFAGGFHFIGRIPISPKWLEERGISVPTFPGESNAVLFSGNSYTYGGGNGEVYGKPGQFNATLYTKNPRREWVDIDEHPDLWDELD